jgi:hypothetical protein
MKLMYRAEAMGQTSAELAAHRARYERMYEGTVALSDRVAILDLAAGDGTRSQPCLPWSSVSDARHKTAGSAPRPQAVAYCNSALWPPTTIHGRRASLFWHW